jgi:hypothetical protein
MATCSGREHEIDPRNPSIHHEVVGWTRDRRRRPGVGTQGGLNTISYVRRTGRMLCEECFGRMKETGNARQETML